MFKGANEKKKTMHKKKSDMMGKMDSCFRRVSLYAFSNNLVEFRQQTIKCGEAKRR
jgi:hypothetical protein